MVGVGSAAMAASSPRAVSPELTVSLLSEQTALVPGQRQWLGVLLEHAPEWHSYWSNAGDSGIATKLSWQLPAGFEAGDIVWPYPQRFDLAGIVNFGYDQRVLLPLTLDVPRALVPGSSIELPLRVDYLVCKEECIPGRADLVLTMAVAVDAPADLDHAADFAAARARWPQAVDWPASVQIDPEQVVIEIGLPAGLKLGTRWDLFPVDKEIIANAVPRERTVGNGVLRWTVSRSDYFSAAPERMGLVLVTAADGPAAAYQISAPVVDLSAALPAAGDSPGTLPAMGLGLALLFALVGGVILNLMPCVFPVLALKALALQGDHSGLRHGVLYSAGVVLSFLALAGLLLLLRAGGEAMGWGFQLQSPWLVGALAYLFFAMGLSLSGLFSFGERLMGLGQDLGSGESDRAAFFTGVLAAVVASPCTAPLMAAALGYALTQSPAVALLVFATLGLGLALPFLLLSMFPNLARWMPRPGAWMERFKQVLAFPLYLSAVWLLWVYGEQRGVLAMGLLAAGAVALAFALWMWGGPTARTPLSRLARGLTICAALVAGAYGLVLGASGPTSAAATSASEHSRPFSPEGLAALRAAGQPVLVNMTAAWCITCLANERVALSTDSVRAALRERGVVYMKGDWTSHDATITQYLAQYGRSGVPLYVLYPANGGAGKVLPQLLTPAIVVKEIEAL